MKAGGRYEHLNKVIFLAFTNFVVFPEKEAFKSEHIILDKQTQENDLDRFSFTFVELPKFEQKRKQLTLPIETLSEEEKFYYFLYHAARITPEELTRLIQDSPIIERAFKELDAFFWNEEEVHAYEAEEKRQLDYIASISLAERQGIEKGKKQGREEGRQQGREEGRQQGILDTARKMQAAGLDVSLIRQVTGINPKELV